MAIVYDQTVRTLRSSAAARLNETEDRLGSIRYGIIGGGIVGLAIARALALRGDDVTVLEKEDRVAAHQTGRNSGVVHAGIYYTPGSLKARLCARGRAMLREYCEEQRLPYRELGKLVVAVDNSEIPRLEEIERRARENGVPGLVRLDEMGLREIEPHCEGVAAVHSPHTASVDYAAIAEAMAAEIRGAGGRVLLRHEVFGIRQDAGRLHVAAGAVRTFDRIVVCAGLQSDLVARMAGASPSPRVLPFRGEYWAMAGAGADLVRGMIYPVPDPRFPFLGVHFTRGVYDDVRAGPNAVPALAREGYRYRNVSVRDAFGAVAWPGALPLLRRHWRLGLHEVAGSVLKPVYLARARRFLPELRARDLISKTTPGVRAQAWGRDGSLLDDFAVDRVGEVVLLRNAPSPAATSSMAIAELVLEQHFPVP